MFKKISTVALIGASVAALSVSTFAAVPKATGIYLEGNLGYGKVSQTVSGSSKNTNTGFVWNVDGGYKFMENFGAEVGFTMYPNQKYDNVKGNQNYILDVAAKGILPIDDGFSLFGKLGIAAVHHKLTADSGYTVTNSGTHTKPALFLGVGAGYNVTENFAIIIQANGTTKNGAVPAMYMGGVGVNYIF